MDFAMLIFKIAKVTILPVPAKLKIPLLQISLSNIKTKYYKNSLMVV